jgi:pterin-4a-carbinolamine dehydratase
MPVEVEAWRQENGVLLRELHFRDFDAAFRFVGIVGRGCVDYQRRPDMAISEFNHVRLSIANPHHAGVTHAELRLAARVDAIIAWAFPAVPP